jgi:hypothetical protein
LERNAPPDLGSTKRDGRAAVLRAAAGLFPYGGQALAELIDHLIPNQRVQRIETYLRYLAERLDTLEEGELRSRLRDPERIDLFEDGALQAVRALSDERQQQITTLVANGIADKTCDYLENKRVLRLLGELDDPEIIMLAAYLPENRTGEYRRRHAHVLKEASHGYRRPAIGEPQREKDRYVVHDAGEQHLLRLGLLSQRQRRDRDVGRPSRPEALTALGRLLLQRIGIAKR